MTRNTIFLILFSLYSTLYAQERVSNQLEPIRSINVNTAFHLPGGDLIKRFGPSSMLGLSYQDKGENNFYWGMELSALVGSQIKDDKVIDIITFDDGTVVNVNGNQARVRFSERGGHSQFVLGKIFSVIGPNQNSGLFFQAGLGYLFHKIRIEDIGNLTPQLNAEMLKGYDRLCMGFTSSQLLGYRHFSDQGRVNFYLGFEFIQAFTEDFRGYDYNTQSAYQDKRLDLLSGFKLGWTLLLKSKSDNQYFYY